MSLVKLLITRQTTGRTHRPLEVSLPVRTDLDMGIFWSPHGLVHLLGRVRDGDLREIFLDGGVDDSDTHGCRHPAQVVNGGQQCRSRRCCVGESGDGVGRGRNQRISDPTSPRDSHSEAEAREDKSVVGLCDGVDAVAVVDRGNGLPVVTSARPSAPVWIVRRGAIAAAGTWRSCGSGPPAGPRISTSGSTTA